MHRGKGQRSDTKPNIASSRRHMKGVRKPKSILKGFPETLGIIQKGAKEEG
jgi:hypothetical protein